MAKFAAWANQPQVADRNKLSLFWSPTYLGIDTHLHSILTSGSVRPSPPNKNKFGEGVDALFSVRGREET